MTRFRPANATLIALMLVLLLAQWAGLQHRVGHYQPLAQVTQTGLAAVDEEGLDDLSHSCLLFDVAALGVAVDTPFFSAPCARPDATWIRQFFLPSWHARLTRHFSPRAPPSN